MTARAGRAPRREQLRHPRAREPELARYGGAVGDRASVDRRLHVVREGELLGDLRGPAHRPGLRERWRLGERDAPALAAKERPFDDAELVPALPCPVFVALGAAQASEIVDRIDGETLDAIARLWYRGKGWPDPEEKSLEAAQIKIENWKPGELVSWGEALVGVRQDIYRVGDRVFEAIDLYCVAEV